MNSIVFAGGCFWGVQHYLKMVKGVTNTLVGYTAGRITFPTYQAVCSGETGHTEAVKVDYDPTKTNLLILLEHFFNIIDPTTLNRQGPDVGTQYRTGIYYYEDSDKDLIYKYIDSIKDNYSNPIVVEVAKASEFWEGEDYHQDYLETNMGGYCHIPKLKYKCIDKIDELARAKYI